MVKDLLLVIDMQNDFASISGALSNKETCDVVEKVEEKIRNWKGYVAATLDTHHTDSYPKTLEGATIPEHCIEDTIGWGIVPTIKVALNEQGSYLGDVNKRTFASDCLGDIIESVDNIRIHIGYHGGGYFGCEEKDNCDENEARVRFETSHPDVRVTLVGVCTDICVVSNALALRALYPNLQINVDASCCAGTTPEKHRAALEVMKSCGINVYNE